MIHIHRFMLRACAIASLACTLVPAVLAGELKVDINNVSRNQAVNTEPGYTMWSTIIPSGNPGTTVNGTAPITQNFTTSTGENVTVSFAQTPLSASRGGTGIIANWFQVGVQNGTTRLAGDGIGAGPVNAVAGGELEMKISGLSAGEHTLLTYHNAVDNPATNLFGPIDIFVNGTKVFDNLQQTIRAATNLAAATAYMEFSVSGPSDVVTILFSAKVNPTVSLPAGVNLRRTPFINGFEIDTPNFNRIANTPYPADFDEHSDADAGITLGWNSALSGSVVSHDIYFGTDKLAVKNATHSSPEFKGNRTTRTFPVTGLSDLQLYYWRVDEIDTINNTTKGAVWQFRPRHLAFPGAEGYGRFAIGGRGGVVVKVTNLNDSGPGSLRDAIEGAYGPRTVVFDVSGLITLEKDIIIDGFKPNITVAGQTAPGKGITIKRQQFAMSGARDVIVRYLRLLVGKESDETQNATGMAGVNHAIMDHCSIGWGIDEGLSTRTARNLTFQRCSLSEALNVAGHNNYPAGTAHGYAASIGGDIASFHHNLLAHNEGRNWSMAGGLDGSGAYSGRLDIFNNVVYNWGGRTTDGGAMEVNFVNNYYKPGASTHIFTALNPQYGGFPGKQQYYMSGNVMPGYFDESNQAAGFKIGTESGGILPQNSTPPYSATVNAPFFPSYAIIHSAKDAYKQVLSDVGCNAPQIDDRDIRIINETLNGTYTYVGSVSGKKGLPDTTDDIGGWENYPEVHRAGDFDSDNDGLPDWWEKIKGLNPYSPAGNFSDANADSDGDGYTNLEDYLNWLASPHADVEHDSSFEIDLSTLTRGYTNGPVHTVFAAQNGNVTLAADGKTAIFVPTRNIVGLGSFRYTVTDAEGSSLSGVVNLHIFARPPVITSTDMGGVYGSAFSLGIEATHLPISYSATGLPPGLEVDPVTGLISGTPTIPGTYTIVISATNIAGTSSVTLSFTINKAIATLSLADQRRSYTGSPVNATATTSPAGLNIVYSYNGSSEAPIYPGAYAVIAMIDDANYQGTAAGTLVVNTTALVRHAPAMNGGIDGSIQMLLPESFAFNGQSFLSGDLLVPGTPAVQLNGNPTLGGIIDGIGSASPINYTVTLNGNALVHTIVRHVDPLVLPVVPAPAAPLGTRNVVLSNTSQSPGDFSILRNLTLSGTAGLVAVPPGTYGSFIANGSSGFILGVAGATEPAVYNLQSLSLNVLPGSAKLQIVGPVVITLANSTLINGTAGASANPNWLTLRIANGGLTISGNAAFYGHVIAPNGAVIINGTATLTGTVTADRLTTNGNGLLEEATP